MAVLHMLRKHDADHPADGVLPLAAVPIDERTRAAICGGAQHGAGVAELARSAGRPRSTVYAVLVQERAERLSERRVRFVDDPLYHGEDAATAVDAIVADGELPVEPPAEQMRTPRDLPPYLCDLYRTPLLSPTRERALFLKFNFHKFQFATARRRLDPELASARDLALLEGYLRDATAVKNDILRANLRLVVSVARRHVRPRGGVTLMDLISEGNLTLMRAVEGFDVHKGFRFSTYATLALMKGFARAVPLLAGAGRRTVSDGDLLAGVADARGDAAAEQQLDRDHVHHLLERLGDRERQVLRARYGLGDTPASCEQVGRQMGLSEQRVRQIERAAIEMLRGTESPS
jgi:RNA polymerase primary sigma factor